jgi:UDP-N-acetylglucosamine--N-acetylmuramyl-(pentapeptide) pyrophosphoryl-undecaprenol N-acetylglucosamine transferase
MKKILFTGGGSAGHVTPNVGLIETFLRDGWQVSYIGSVDGIEKDIIAELDIDYYSISSGKLRRYFSWQNFIDPVRILLGIVQSFLLCRRLSPDILFSKGGFISVPVVIGAWLNRIAVITHESDITPGLANRLCFPFAERVCVTFPETVSILESAKVMLTGTPVRAAILSGDAAAGRRLLGLDSERKTLLFFGGSLGATAINTVVHASLQQLLKDHQIVHICGAGNMRTDLASLQNYHQLEYLHEEFGDLLACADLVVSRAGANSIYELLLCKKPHILIPLSAQVSRGDQIINARTFAKLGYSKVIEEEALTAEVLCAAILGTLRDSTEIIARIDAFQPPDAVNVIHVLILATVQNGKSA